MTGLFLRIKEILKKVYLLIVGDEKEEVQITPISKPKKRKEILDSKENRDRLAGEIINCFRLGKITSVTIDGEVIYEYSKLPKDALDRDIKINKKFLSLFNKKSMNLLVKYFVKDGETLVYRPYRGDFIRVVPTLHAKERLISRFLALKVSHNTSISISVFKYIDEKLYDVIENDIKFYYEPSMDVNVYLRDLCIRNSNIIDEVIRELMSLAQYEHNQNHLVKHRCDKRGNVSVTYYDKLFRYIYDLREYKLVTLELIATRKKDSISTGYARCINGNTEKLFERAVRAIYEMN